MPAMPNPSFHPEPRQEPLVLGPLKFGTTDLPVFLRIESEKISSLSNPYNLDLEVRLAKELALFVTLASGKSYDDDITCDNHKQLHFAWKAASFPAVSSQLKALFDEINEVGTGALLKPQAGKREVAIDIMTLADRGAPTLSEVPEAELNDGELGRFVGTMPGLSTTSRSLEHFDWSNPAGWLTETLSRVRAQNSKIGSKKIVCTGFCIRGPFANIVVNLKGLTDPISQPCTITFVTSLANLNATSMAEVVQDGLIATNPALQGLPPESIQKFLDHLRARFRDNDAFSADLMGQARGLIARENS